MTNIARLPGALDHRWNWQLDGACRSADSGLFFHPVGERGEAHDSRESAAKAVCAGCPVRRECLRYALEAHERYGVWGGLGENERLRLGRRAPKVRG
ncbi:WhiB family transcriptional regulator [Kitasatospora sp. NPDC003701]